MRVSSSKTTTRTRPVSMMITTTSIPTKNNINSYGTFAQVSETLYEFIWNLCPGFWKHMKSHGICAQVSETMYELVWNLR